MLGRPVRWIFACGAVAAGLGPIVVAPSVGALSAGVAPAHVSQTPAGAAGFGALVTPAAGRRQKQANGYAGYYENFVGPTTLTSTIVVPTAKCTNSTTWGNQVAALALMDTSAGVDEHGGGIVVGCASVTGTPTYAAALCDPSLPSKCGAQPDPVVPGDVVQVTVAATGGCNPTCASLTVTVADSTQGWSESWNGTSPSDFDTFVAALGNAPLVNFGQLTFTGVSLNHKGYQGRKSNLVAIDEHTLAKASKLTQGRTRFSVKWVRAS